MKEEILTWGIYLIIDRITCIVLHIIFISIIRYKLKYNQILMFNDIWHEIEH